MYNKIIIYNLNCFWYIKILKLQIFLFVITFQFFKINYQFNCDYFKRIKHFLPNQIPLNTQ